jgi:hypothetical protein
MAFFVTGSIPQNGRADSLGGGETNSLQSGTFQFAGGGLVFAGTQM